MRTEKQLFNILRKAANGGGQAQDLYTAACNRELRVCLENNHPRVLHDVWDAAVELAEIRELHITQS